MKYVALAVLLVVAQASPPVPQKASHGRHRTSHNVEKEGQSNKAPSPNPPPSISTDATKQDESNSHGIRAEDQEQIIRITNLPPVTVTPQKRDLADWGIWLFNLLLVVVGGLQVLLLCRTLKAVKRQAHEMKRQRIAMRGQLATMQGQLLEMGIQTGILQESIAHAEKSADAAKKSADLLVGSERPWIIVTAKLSAHGDVFVFSLVNCGRTPANILSARTYNSLTPPYQNIPAQPNEAPYTDLNDFGIIAPKESSEEATVLDTLRLWDSGEDDFTAVKNGSLRLLRYIAIVYKNTLDQSMIHETKLAYRYDFLRKEFQRQHINGYTKYS